MSFDLEFPVPLFFCNLKAKALLAKIPGLK